MATTIKVKGIMSYPHLFTPRSVNPGDDPKFSVNVLIAKNDPQVQQVVQAIEVEKRNTFPNGFPGNGKLCLKDCADPAGNYSSDLHGYYELRTNSGADNKPHLVDANLQPVMDQSLVYGGAEAWFHVNLAGYNQPINKGVGAYINGVMLTGREGALGRLDNKQSAEQMFSEVTGGAPAPAPTFPGQVPAAPAAPVPPAPPAPAAPQHMMTPAANGVTYEAYKAAGWTDDALIQNGLMLPPGGAPLAFNQ